MKTCRICRTEKPLKDFGNLSRSQDGKDTRCLECHREYDRNLYRSSEHRRAATYSRVKKRRLRNQRYIYQYLTSHPCPCGEVDPVVLQFDHRDGTNKKFNIGSSGNVSLDVLKEEIDKCDVLCANCHLRRTSVQFGWYKFLENSGE